jgi:hypothetical protein
MCPDWPAVREIYRDGTATGSASVESRTLRMGATMAAETQSVE